MRLPFYIAKRYLFAKKSHNLINIITWISIVGVGVASFAMIFILSVFNGFNKVISETIHKLTPDINIESAEGKTLNINNFPFDSLKQIKGIDFVFPTITEDALFRNKERQHIGQIKGVPMEYGRINRVAGTVLGGDDFILEQNDMPFAVSGVGVAYFLGVNVYSPAATINIYVPKRGDGSSFSLEKSFNSGIISISATFSTQQECDEQLVIAPFQWVSKLLGYEGKATSVEVFVSEKSDIKSIQKQIRDIVGNKFSVKNQYEQQETLYKMMKSEKSAIYVILVFVMILAVFNVVGSLSMLIIDKRRDVTVLKSIGADGLLIKRIFLNEGLLISVAGGLIGLIIGIIAVFLQERFGFISLGDGGSYIVNAYPVSLALTDIILVFFTIVIIGGLSSFLTVGRAVKRLKDERL